MNKQPDITEATRQVFIDAFCILYKVKPIERITIRELTDKAGYNRSTFYKYFNDIYALLTSIEDDTILNIKETITDNIKHWNFEEEYLFKFAKVHEEKAKYFDVLLGNPNGLRFAERLKTEMTLLFIEEFHLSKADVKNTYTLEFYLSGVISTVRRWLINQREISSKELAELIRNMLPDSIFSQMNKYR